MCALKSCWQRCFVGQLIELSYNFCVDTNPELTSKRIDPIMGFMEIRELTHQMHRFVRSKGWYEPASSRPQTLKNLAISLVLEAAEVLEQFQWQDQPMDKEMLAEELADVFLYLLQISSLAEIDLEKVTLEKLEKNHQRSWD